MTKKIFHEVRSVSVFLAQTSWMQVAVSLSLLLLLCTACGGTNTTSASSPGFQTMVQTTDKLYTVQVTITPNQLGNNTFAVKLLSPQQSLNQNVQVSLQTTMLDMAMGTDSLSLQSNSQGSFSGQGTLTMSGHWQIRIVIHALDHTVHEGQFQATLA